MKTSAECLPCLLNRVIETAAQVTPDAWLHKKVMLDVAAAIVSGSIDFDRSPAEVTSEALLRACSTLHADPFADARRHMNDALLSQLPGITAALQKQPSPLLAAGRLAAICNDPEVFTRPVDAAALVADSASRRFAVDDFARLEAALGTAKRVLYILDNAGEIVADRLFIEAIGPRRVTAVVRKKPLMRDALDADAAQVALPCRVIHTGCDLAGAPAAFVSLDFRREVDRADVVIAKGESAYQTMEEGPWKAYHLLVARCCCTARHLKVAAGSALCMAREAQSGRRAGTKVAWRA
ncbi:MAG: ARMT1-like domain-containing protein [Planctomycetota bacterium]